TSAHCGALHATGRAESAGSIGWDTQTGCWVGSGRSPSARSLVESRVEKGTHSERENSGVSGNARLIRHRGPSSPVVPWASDCRAPQLLAYWPNVVFNRFPKRMPARFNRSPTSGTDSSRQRISCLIIQAQQRLVAAILKYFGRPGIAPPAPSPEQTRTSELPRGSEQADNP